MRNLVLEIAYDGTLYYGWQTTNTGPSVEGTLQEILEQILQHPITLQAASRTDRGVHAAAQLVNFHTEKSIPCERLLSSLNRLLPKDISVLSVYEASLSFHPTLSVVKKEYRYRIWNKPVANPFVRAYSWHVPQLLDLDLMKNGALHLVGEHDFSSFCNYRKDLRYQDHIRNVMECAIVHEGKLLVIKVVGDHFLYKMVRNIVGTLVYVGLNKIAPDTIPSILHAKKRPQAGVTAPAHGLTLYKVWCF